ncbi:MAG: tetratricopeptide repeat protein, partial [Holophagae bacterium]
LTVTGTGEILGTPAYMSPEQIEGKPATTRSDIYSLGLVMYEMLTGAQAFEGESAFQIALSKLRDQPTHPSARSPGLRIPPRWEKTILRCLEKDPEDRFAEVAMIPRVLAGEQTMPRRTWRRIVSGHRFRAAVAVVALIAALGLAAAIGGWRPWAGGADAVAGVEIRRSVAVLGFENNTDNPDVQWISTALGDFLTTELGVGGGVRAVPSESVARARTELGIDHVTTLAPETLGRLRDLLATDLVVLGSYTVLGDGDDATIRLDSRVQEVDGGEIIILPPVTGTSAELAGIARGAASAIRVRFGLDAVADSAASGAFPTDPEAARLYAEGVSHLRSFDPDGARDLLQKAAETEPDSPLIWIELANAWTELGYGEEALDAARRATELSRGLERELRLRTAGQYQLLAGRWDEAIDTFRSLWLVYPDNLEYGLLFARAQVEAGRPQEALATVEELRALPEPLNRDPRIDLAEAAAAGATGDVNRREAAAERVVEASHRIGSKLLEAEGRLSLGTALRDTGQLDASLEELEVARRLSAEAGNRSGEANAMYAIALTRLALGDIDQAVDTTQQCLIAAREVGDRPAEGDALNLLGSIRVRQGDFAGAEAAFSDALALQREIDNRSGAADALNNLALVQMWSGDFVQSVDNFSQALQQYRELGRPQMEAAVMMNLARIDAARGDLNRARSRFEEAVGLYRNEDLTEGLAEALFGLGEVLLTQGDLKAARSRHEEAYELRETHRLGSVVESRFALAGLTLAEASVGKRSYSEAADELSQSLQQLADSGRTSLEADAINYLVEAEIEAGRLDAAQEHLKRLEALSSSANPVTIMVGDINRARLAGKLGGHEHAAATLEAVIRDARAQSSLGVELEAKLAMAEIQIGAGRPDAARMWLDEVQREAVAQGWMLVADKASVLGQRLDGDRKLTNQ